MDFFKVLSDIASFGAPARKWIDSTATFTGLAVDKDNNFLKGSEGVPFAYEMSYPVGGRTVIAWYMFPNGETPDPKQLAGTTMPIRYREDEPDLFEKAEL